MAHRIVAPIVLVGLSALVGCAHENAPPVVPAPAPVSVTQTTSHVAEAPRPGINASEEILRACQIRLDNVDSAPEFDFDKSDLRPGDRDVLQQVATCVTTGPLKGRSLHLVGRADPRGEVEYNFVLGESRAGSVSNYLIQLGLGQAKVTTTSRGKLDATGNDEAAWQRDRRVDLDLQ
jgi:peptidoglycan-associated lipoprotein